MADQAGAASLFAIFFLAIYSLILIPVTIYLLCNPKEEAVKPWEAVSCCACQILGSNTKSCLVHSLPLV